MLTVSESILGIAPLEDTMRHLTFVALIALAPSPAMAQCASSDGGKSAVHLIADQADYAGPALSVKERNAAVMRAALEATIPTAPTRTSTDRSSKPTRAGTALLMQTFRRGGSFEDALI
jgi:hypothetical protein